MYTVLSSKTDGHAFTFIKNGEKGNGAGAWRRLGAEFDPKLASNAQAYLKQILNIPRTGKIGEASAAIQKLEHLVRQYEEQRGGREIDPDLKLRRLYDILPAQLESHLVLENRDNEVTYGEVIKRATSWILANSNGQAAMDIGIVEQAPPAGEWRYDGFNKGWNYYPYAKDQGEMDKQKVDDARP